MKSKLSRRELDWLVACELQEDWRRKTPHKTRPKRTTGQAWIEKNGTDTVDLVITIFPDLPLDWQAENFASAIVANNLIEDGVTDIEAASAKIHVEWLKRNFEHAEPAQKLDYDDPNFPEDQRKLDRNVFRVALAINKKYQA